MTGLGFLGGVGGGVGNVSKGAVPWTEGGARVGEVRRLHKEALVEDADLDQVQCRETLGPST